ncbi:MAG: serpin family protein, partial [Halobacteria archaeon]
MKWKVITFAIITIALATIANVLLLYNSPENISNRANDTSATYEGISSIVNANNQFALDLYSELNNETGNLFFSPLSISTAFAMIYEGARGQTAEEIQSIFHFPEDNTTRRSSFA